MRKYTKVKRKGRKRLAKYSGGMVSRAMAATGAIAREAASRVSPIASASTIRANEEAYSRRTAILDSAHNTDTPDLLVIKYGGKAEPNDGGGGVGYGGPYGEGEGTEYHVLSFNEQVIARFPSDIEWRVRDGLMSPGQFGAKGSSEAVVKEPVAAGEAKDFLENAKTKFPGWKAVLTGKPQKTPCLWGLMYKHDEHGLSDRSKSLVKRNCHANSVHGGDSQLRAVPESWEINAGAAEPVPEEGGRRSSKKSRKRKTKKTRGGRKKKRRRRTRR